MDFINFKFLLLFIFFLNGVNSLTEEEVTLILQKFETKIHEQLSEATRDIPDIKTAIQGTKVISGLLSLQIKRSSISQFSPWNFYRILQEFWANDGALTIYTTLQ